VLRPGEQNWAKKDDCIYNGACSVLGELFFDDSLGITRPNAQQGGGVMDASVLLKPLLAR
jgi:hypothetical protein